MNKVRLDNYLVLKGYTPSRSKASELIHNGKVKVNNKVILKPSFDVSEEDIIEVLENKVLKYVSRGGLKLEKGIEYFNLDLANKVILDIGSSTGGFTDCALQHGAKYVYALDVGTNQLHESLLSSENVFSMENTNFKDVTKDMFDKDIDLYVCDVSFISIQTILRKLNELDENFNIVILFKPQFEVGKNNLNKNGVVKNKNILINALNNFEEFLKIMNISIVNATYSPITGNKEGNIEFLFYLNNSGISKKINYNSIVEEAISVLKVKS